MIWFYERSGEYAIYEVRSAIVGGFEVVMTAPGGGTTVEHFARDQEAVNRWAELEARLRAEGWKELPPRRSPLRSPTSRRHSPSQRSVG
jgi:hypothetical protein